MARPRQRDLRGPQRPGDGSSGTGADLVTVCPLVGLLGGAGPLKDLVRFTLYRTRNDSFPGAPVLIHR